MRLTLPVLGVLLVVVALGALTACDDATNNLIDGDGGAGGGDGGPGGGDGGLGGGDGGPCSGDTECSDCLDNDADGLVDGFDPECIGPLDRDESSFATGIPGDNMDPKVQDCFFDGNSGGGQDCKFHTCCILDLADQPGGVCPADLQPPNYDPAKCAVTQSCIDNCVPLTPPGCDCFGCCTVCDDIGCRDILTNTAVSPDCTQETLHDAAKCFSCTKSDACTGVDCDPEQCVLCPGQLPEDLPDHCQTSVCPGGEPCATTADCAAGDFCSVGCCIAGID